MEIQYDLDFFIKRFENIPQEKWGTKAFNKDGKCCAFGHCGAVKSIFDSNMALELSFLLDIQYSTGGAYLAMVNDGAGETKQYGDNPKDRVVNYLKSLKK